jgi:lipopolysaccharide export system protein LptA
MAAPLLLLACAAQAERADRLQPMVVESDGQQAATVDLARKITVVSGHVLITQGTLKVQADRVEVREVGAGRYTALATGQAGEPARYRQKRDRPDEVLEAQAERIEIDGQSERTRFSGAAQLRILRNGVVSDEASAAVIVYDQKTDTLVFEGGERSAARPEAGRARLVFTPRQEAASAPAGAGK